MVICKQRRKDIRLLGWGLLWSLVTSVSPFIIDKPVDTEVRVGDSTYLNCSVSDASADVSWYHYPVGKGSEDLRYVFTNNKMREPYNQRFRLERTTSAGAFNLVIMQADVQDAGIYVCQDNTGTPVTADLVVLKSHPECTSNINATHGLIGPNGCDIQKEPIQLSCGVSYSGNSPPKVQWTRISGNGSHSIPQSCTNSEGRLTCINTTVPNIDLDGSYFVCLTSSSKNVQYNCSTKIIKILYAFSNSSPTEMMVGETAKCTVVHASSVRCNYTWKHTRDDQNDVVSSNERVTIVEEGWHRCEASCSIKDHHCHFDAMTVKASANNDVSHLYGIIAILCVITAVLSIAFITISVVRKRKHYQTLQDDLHQREWEMDQMFFRFYKELIDYRSKPKSIHTIETKASQQSKALIYGIAILNDELFTISRSCTEFEVYSLANKTDNAVFAQDRPAVKAFPCICIYTLNAVANPKNLVACRINNCLYIEERRRGQKLVNEIVRVNRTGETINRWAIPEDIGRISVTSASNVIVTLRKSNALHEYTPKGILVRQINIDEEKTRISHLRHAVLLTSGHFVLCHGDEKDKVHRICIVNRNGQLIKAIGEDELNPRLKISNPQYLEVDSNGFILVADDKRIVAFSPKLEFEAELLANADGLWSTFRVCLDMKRGYLLVADNEHTHELIKATGKVLIYELIHASGSQQSNSNSCHAST